jgi:uncharacterized membrane protein
METAPPNLHPALIHFPIAAVTLGLLADVGLALRIVPSRFDAAAASLWAVAALGGLAAYLSGEAAHDALPALDEVIHEAIEAHEHAALPAVVALFAVALLRIADLWRAARSGAERRALRWTALALALVAQGLVLRAADRGGVLVYRHGVAVEAVTLDPNAAAPHEH